MSEKYELIAAECAEYDTAADDAVAVPTMKQMFTALEVSKSGYYEWLTRAPSATQKRRDELKLKITALFDHFDGAYGYRRLHAELVRGGEQVGDELVRDLMRELGLAPVQPKPYRAKCPRALTAR